MRAGASSIHRRIVSGRLNEMFMQLFVIGWSLFFTILIVRDLQEKWPVPRMYRFLGWCTFRTSLLNPVLGASRSLTVSQWLES